MTEHSTLTDIGYPEIIEELVRLFPNCVFIFDPDGNLISGEKKYEGSIKNIQSPGEYNILKDPACGAPEMQAALRKAFSGEIAEIPYHPKCPYNYSENRSDSPIAACPVVKADGSLAAVVILHEKCLRNNSFIKLRKDDEKYRVLVENSHDGIAIIQDFGFTYSNSRFYEITGYTLEDLKKLDPSELCAPEFRDMIRRHLIRWIAGENIPSNYEAKIFHKSGKDKWVEVKVSGAVWNGRPAAMIAFYDISDRKKAEEEILKTQKRLQEMNDELKHLNKEMESFVYSISHDLKSPLLSIEGMVEIILSQEGSDIDDDIRNQMGRIKVNASRMSMMVNDLLELSRVGRIDTSFENIDVMLVARQVAACTEGRMAGRKIKTVISGDSIKVNYPPVRLSQIFLNLVDNAVKFIGDAPEPEIKINIEAKEEEVVVSVSDNGIGIDPRFHEEIFLPFRRLAPAKNFPGTGMGLGIVKKIIKSQGGNIWLESEPGKGATFYFTIKR